MDVKNKQLNLILGEYLPHPKRFFYFIDCIDLRIIRFE